MKQFSHNRFVHDKKIKNGRKNPKKDKHTRMRHESTTTCSYHQSNSDACRRRSPVSGVDVSSVGDDFVTVAFHSTSTKQYNDNQPSFLRFCNIAGCPDKLYIHTCLCHQFHVNNDVMSAYIFFSHLRLFMLFRVFTESYVP